MVAQLKDKNSLDLFHENGFLVIKKFFPKDICIAIKNEGLAREACSFGNYSPVINVHKENPIFLRAMSYQPLINIVEQICNGFVRGLQSQLFYHMPGTPGFKWHQDNFYVQAQPAESFVSVWLALDHKITPENGALKVATGSHHLGLCNVKNSETETKCFNTQQDVNATKLESIFEKDDFSIEEVNMTMGDIVFIHSLVQHSSFANTTSDRSRMSLLMTYIKNGTPFRAGENAKREDFNVYL